MAQQSESHPAYSAEQATALARRHSRGMGIQTVRFCGEGASFCSYAINEELLFRLGTSSESAERLKWEERLLPQLRHRLEVAVPQFEFTGTTENGYAFAVYSMIKGTPFSAAVYRGLPEPAQERVVKQLAGFLARLHDFPVEEAAACGVRKREMVAWCAEFREQAREEVYPELSEREARECEWRFHQYFGTPELHIYTPALTHGDLKPRHIFLDPAQQCIAGVIDFEDIWISDPDYDLHCLLTEYGPVCTDRLLDAYGHSHPERLRWKTRMFALCLCIDQIVWGTEDRHPRDVAEGLRRLKCILADTAMDNLGRQAF